MSKRTTTALGIAVLLLGTPASYALAGQGEGGKPAKAPHQCSDTVDNDADGLSDADDPDCGSPNDNSEGPDDAQEPGGEEPGTPGLPELPALPPGGGGLPELPGGGGLPSEPPALPELPALPPGGGGLPSEPPALPGFPPALPEVPGLPGIPPPPAV